MHPVRSLQRLVFPLLLLALSAHNPPAPAPADAETISTREVRIRKLHLVRPDLLHYPLALEVLC